MHLKDLMISIMSGWQHIFDEVQLRTLEPGEVLFRREDRIKSMYFVRSGEVALERPLADGTSLTLHCAKAGSALAEASLFADTYHCDAVARTPSQVAVIRREDFLSALKDRPAATLSRPPYIVSWHSVEDRPCVEKRVKKGHLPILTLVMS